MTRYDRTLEEAIIAAGHSVRRAWQMPGPANTGVEGMECLIINGHTVIVQTFKDAGWDVYTPSQSNSVDETIKAVLLACKLPTGDEYLDRFPEDQRVTADVAYQDGFQDGVSADANFIAKVAGIHIPDDDRPFADEAERDAYIESIEDGIDVEYAGELYKIVREARGQKEPTDT